MRNKRRGFISPMMGITTGIAIGMFMSRNSNHGDKNPSQNKATDIDTNNEMENIAKSGSGQQDYL